MTRKTTITIEAKSLLILHSCNSGSAWCPKCGAEVEAVALETEGVTSYLGEQALEKWLDSGELHRIAAPDGSVLICLNSLLAHAQNQKPPNRGFPRLLNTEKEKT